jgi:hypothetical protein
MSIVINGNGGITGITAPWPLADGGTGQSLTNSGVVKQGGGIGQLGNQVYIGWTGDDLVATVDGTDVKSILGVANSRQSWHGFAIGTGVGERTATATGATTSVYTNTTNAPILVVAMGTSGTTGSPSAIYNQIVGKIGTATVASNATSGSVTSALSILMIVPPGASYHVEHHANSSVDYWAELY